MRIDEVKPSQRRAGRFLVKLEDGSILRLGEAEVLRFGLRAGTELDAGLLSEIEAAARCSQVKAQAAALSGSRALSRRELEEKLARRGAGAEDIQAAVNWLEELGAIDDAGYARLVARHYGDRGYGPGRVREELRRRGVPREFWDGALAELPDSGKAIDAYLQKKCRGAAPDEGERRRLADALRRRGFAWEDVQSALERLERG